MREFFRYRHTAEDGWCHTILVLFHIFFSFSLRVFPQPLYPISGKPKPSASPYLQTGISGIAILKPLYLPT